MDDKYFIIMIKGRLLDLVKTSTTFTMNYLIIVMVSHETTVTPNEMFWRYRTQSSTLRSNGSLDHYFSDCKLASFIKGFTDFTFNRLI